jgi:restriction system protein
VTCLGPELAREGGWLVAEKRAWLVRAGRHGERETLAVQSNLVVVGWQELPDLSGYDSRESLTKALQAAFPDDGAKRLLNWQAQLWAFLHSISKGDLVVLPLKTTSAVAIGVVAGDYQYRPDLPPDARHTRPVRWLRTDLARTAFGQDLLYSLGAFLTVCEVKRHDAVRRLDSLAGTGHDPGWAKSLGGPPETEPVITDEATNSVDIQRLAADQISARIEERFTGHGLARLIDAIFEARGMVTWRAPEGRDGGADILVGSGPLGMDSPRICIQVKSSDSPVNVGVVRELQGVLGRLNADQGLLVAWGGLNQAAEREIRQQFFQVRVWTADDVLRELTAVYDKLSGEMQADLPLKQIWTLAEGEDRQ